jgi:hypothetical protein
MHVKLLRELLLDLVQHPHAYWGPPDYYKYQSGISVPIEESWNDPVTGWYAGRLHDKLFWGIDETLADAGQSLYYHQNALGSVDRFTITTTPVVTQKRYIVSFDLSDDAMDCSSEPMSGSFSGFGVKGVEFLEASLEVTVARLPRCMIDTFYQRNPR